MTKKLENITKWDEVIEVLKDKYGNKNLDKNYEKTVSFFQERAQYYVSIGYGPIDVYNKAFKDMVNNLK